MPAIIDRTWRVQIFTDLGTDPRVEFLRERVKDFGGGDVLRTLCPVVARTLAQVKDRPVPGNKLPRLVQTVGDAFALLDEIGTALALEDAAPAPKKPTT